MKKVLIIEDQSNQIKLDVIELEKKYEVIIASSIEAALNLKNEINNNPFDLIVIDIMMDYRPYTYEQTNGGMETGWIFYKENLMNVITPIIVWTRNSDIKNKNWGKNVKILIKSNDFYDLYNNIHQIIGE